MRIRLELAGVLVVVRIERGPGPVVEVRRVSKHETRSLVHRLVIAADTIAHETVHALGASNAGGKGRAVADSEEVVLAILHVYLRPLGLIGHTVCRQDRRQELPLGKVGVLCFRQTDITDLVSRTRPVHLRNGLGVGVTLLIAEILIGALGRRSRHGRITLEDHICLARVSRIFEGERVAEVEVGVLPGGLVVSAVGLQGRNDLVEAGELHAVLVGMHTAYAECNPRVVRLDVIALGVTIEGDIREEQLDLTAREDACRARPLCLVTV